MDRALLIHGGAIGDFVMSLRVVAALRNAGAGFVAVLGRRNIVSIAVPGGGVDEVLDLDVGGFHALFSPNAELPRHVRTHLGAFDLAVNMLASRAASPDDPQDASANDSAEAGHGIRARLEETGIRHVIDIDPRPRPDWPDHISDQWLSDLRAVGMDGIAGPPRIQLAQSVLDPARRRLEATAGGAAEHFVIIHPGSGGLRKCWPVSSFVKLIDHLRTNGFPVALLLGPVEWERFHDADLRRLRSAAPVVENCSLHEAAALIAGSARFIGNDSGMAHLAAALGAQTVTIFGPTDPRLWRPLGEHVVVSRPRQGETWPRMEDVVQSLPPDVGIDSVHLT